MASLVALISLKLKTGSDQGPYVWSIFWIRRVLSFGPEHNLTEIRCLQRSELHVWSAVGLSNKKVASELHKLISVEDVTSLVCCIGNSKNIFLNKDKYNINHIREIRC